MQPSEPRSTSQIENIQDLPDPAVENQDATNVKGGIEVTSWMPKEGAGIIIDAGLPKPGMNLPIGLPKPNL